MSKITKQGSARHRNCTQDSFVLKLILSAMVLYPLSNDLSLKNWDSQADTAKSQRFISEKLRD